MVFLYYTKPNATLNIFIYMSIKSIKIILYFTINVYYKVNMKSIKEENFFLFDNVTMVFLYYTKSNAKLNIFIYINMNQLRLYCISLLMYTIKL